MVYYHILSTRGFHIRGRGFIASDPGWKVVIQLFPVLAEQVVLSGWVGLYDT